MVKHIQITCRQIADELLECVWQFCEIGAYRVKSIIRNTLRHEELLSIIFYYTEIIFDIILATLS